MQQWLNERQRFEGKCKQLQLRQWLVAAQAGDSGSCVL
jgi:hypothetical protein